jgi:hypothetical protein
MSVSDLLQIGESLHSLSSQNVQFVTAPNEPWTGNPDRVQLEQPQAGQVFSAIAHDVTVPKTSTSAAPSTGGAQVLTTSPANVKVEVLNGSGIAELATKAATSLTSRGFDVTGTGDATSFAYTNSVIEYSSAADMAEVNTLGQELSNVTDLKDASLTPGTVELILGSDYSGLKAVVAQSSPSPTAAASSPAASSSAAGSASPSASATGISGLAQSNGGITAAAACASDSSAFSGPLSP